jgi:peptidoglycan/LPS O-acetylase OafA/YrhL
VNPWLVTASATSASILVALAVYLYVEQPLLNFLRGRRMTGLRVYRFGW